MLPFRAKYQSPFLFGVLFRRAIMIVIAAIHQRSTVLSAEVQEAFELFTLLTGIRFFPVVELA